MKEPKSSLLQTVFYSSAKTGGIIADFLLIVTGLILHTGYRPPSFINSQAEQNSILFLIIISVVPWYMGYLLHHFQVYSKSIRLLFQWSFAIIILSLVVFLILNFMPFLNETDDPSGFQGFLIGFGMFFMVLGPLMLIGGYADAEKVDSAHDPNAPYSFPEVSLVMILLTLAIFFMILIVGFFNPNWSSDASESASFWIVLLAFLGGPLLAIIVCVPFIYIGLWFQKHDARRIVPKSIAILVPLVTFTSLIYWNDIVLENLRTIWDVENPSQQQLFWTLFLSGILPFRIIMLFKPPFSWYGLISGIIALVIYFSGITKSFG